MMRIASCFSHVSLSGERSQIVVTLRGSFVGRLRVAQPLTDSLPLVKRLTCALAILLTLTACGGGSSGSTNNPEAEGTRSKATVSATADKPSSAIDLAYGLKSAVPSIAKTVQITEDNDPNDKIGRPGGYVDAAVMYDSRVDPCNRENFGVECGASIEIWPNAADAKDRSEFIQTTLKGANGVLGSEYHFLKGPTLLRVWGDMKPSIAKAYESAWEPLT